MLLRCCPACGWNLRGAISGNLKLSDQAARSLTMPGIKLSKLPSIRLMSRFAFSVQSEAR
jgi:hypothetical protein